MKQTRVAIYARVSTSEQAEEGFSIDAQVENIKARCKIEDKIVTAIYADRGISGKSMDNRFELQKLLQDCQKDLFDEVFVWKTSRLARNMIDLLQIEKELSRNNVAFRSLTEPYDTSTPTGKLMMTMLAGFAEFERTTIIENLKMGQSARARQGLRNGGKMLGYRTVGTGKDSRLEIVPEEAAIVQKIFDLYIKGNGLRSIASKLNEEGFKSVKGNLYSNSSVRCILTNDTYVGKVSYNKFIDYSTKRRKNDNYILVDGQHEGIISLEDWDKVQMIMSAKDKAFPQPNVSGQSPLTGIMVCPVCGYCMVSSNTSRKLKDGTIRRTRYYTCSQFRNKGTTACHSNSVRAQDAEDYVFSRVNEILMNEKVLRDIVAKLNTERAEKIKPKENEFNMVEKNLAAAIQRKDRIFSLYEDGTIDRATVTERLLLIDANITQLVKRQAEIRWEIDNNGSDDIPFELVRDTMSDFKKLLDMAKNEQRKTFLQLIIKKITVGKSRKVDTIQIHFNDTLRHIVKDFLGEPSSDDEGSAFVFTVVI